MDEQSLNGTVGRSGVRRVEESFPLEVVVLSKEEVGGCG